MKIPNTNICCLFHYELYRLRKITDKVKINDTTYKVNRYEYATSIEEVPYWRLYEIRFEKVETPYGYKYERTVVHKTVANYDYETICTLIKQFYSTRQYFGKIKGVRYSLECWPRKSQFNRKK